MSRWKSCQWSGGYVQGREQQIVTFGRRGSDAYLRFYNKASQMDQEGHWVRVELELRDERATASVVSFLAEGASYLKGVLRGYIDFKKPTSATRLERAESADWWVAFLDHVEKARLVVNPVLRTLETAWNWLQRQAAPSLAFVWEALGVEAFMSLVTSGRDRLQPWQKRLLENT